MTEYREYDAIEVQVLTAEITDLYGAMYAEAPYNVTDGTLPYFHAQLEDDLQREGFGAILAYDEGRLVGLIYGYRFGRGEWWPGSTTPPAHLLDSANRVVKEWGIRPGWRDKGIGRHLMESWLGRGSEPWATLNAHPEAPARQLYARVGWTQVGQSKQDGFTPRDVLVLPLA